MQRPALILSLALFFVTATLADAQEQLRTSAEIQAEIDALQIELQKAKTAEGIPLTVGQFTRPESERQILRLLEMPARQPIILDETSTFADLCVMLSSNDIPAILDMRALANTGTSLRYDTPIVPDDFFPANTNSIKLKNVLKILFEPHELAYVIRNEMLYITTTEASRRQANMSVRVHYVGDITPELTPEEKSDIEKIFRESASAKCCDCCTCCKNKANNPLGGGHGSPTAPAGVESAAGWVYGGGYGCSFVPFGYLPRHGGILSPFGYAAMFGYSPMYAPFNPFATSINNLRDVVQMTIEPDSWEIMGMGGEGSIEVYMPTKSLIIRQTEKEHVQIEELLTQIRQMHALHQTTQTAEQ